MRTLRMFFLQNEKLLALLAARSNKIDAELLAELRSLNDRIPPPR